MPPAFGGKWETECLNTGLPLPTLIYAGYSVKVKIIIIITHLNLNKDRSKIQQIAIEPLY